ncbi:hypothetical protein [Enterococcus florum]|nr:hypothetical protein [Enterococcus florum]
MAHHVGRILHIRPNTILDEWGVPELIVAYGQYSNEDTYRNYLEWKNLDTKSKKEIKKPEAYSVLFLDDDDLEEEEGE